MAETVGVSESVTIEVVRASPGIVISPELAFVTIGSIIGVAFVILAIRKWKKNRFITSEDDIFLGSYS